MTKLFYAVAFFIIALFIGALGYFAVQHSRELTGESDSVQKFLSTVPVVKDDSGVTDVANRAVWRCHSSRYGDHCGWESDWVYTETQNHFVYDGLYIQEICPGFYRGFRMLNDESAIAFMRHAKGRTDKWLSLDVYELPARSSLYDITECPNIKVVDGRLTILGKPLAFVKEAHIPHVGLSSLFTHHKNTP